MRVSDYWVRSAGVSLDEAKAFAEAEGFGFEIGRQSRFENTRNSVIIARGDLRDGLVNKIELAEEIQHGLDRTTHQMSRAKARGATLEEFHAELFERIIDNCSSGKFPFLTAEDVASIREIVVKLRSASC
jgi:hypothetical protein